MTVLVYKHDYDNDDEHDTTRFRQIRRLNVTTPTMTEINSDDSLYKLMVTKGTKLLPCAEGTTRKTRKCTTAACIRTNKGDRCGGTADTAVAGATSLHCSDSVQKTCRPAPSHNHRSSTCNKTTVECRGECIQTVKYGTNDNQQCTSTRNYRANDGQCTSTGNCRANDGQCTSTGKYGANDKPQCTGTRNYGTNDNQQCTSTRNYGANDNRQCASTRNYSANDGQFTGVGNFSTNNSGCNGCGCISATAAVAAAAAATCLGGTNNFSRDGSNDTMVSTVCRWTRAAADWTWDKTSHILVAAMSFFLGMYTYDSCLCTCEDVLET